MMKTHRQNGDSWKRRPKWRPWKRRHENARVNTKKRIHAFDMSVPQPSYFQRTLAGALKRHLWRKSCIVFIGSSVQASTSMLAWKHHAHIPFTSARKQSSVNSKNDGAESEYVYPFLDRSFSCKHRLNKSWYYELKLTSCIVLQKAFQLLSYLCELPQ